MNSIVTIVKGHVSNLSNPFTFIHGKKAEFNKKADDVAGDIAWLAYPIISPIRGTKGGGFEPIRPISIFLCRKTDMGDPTFDQQALIDHTTVSDAMEALCYKLLTLFQKDPEIREVYDYRVMPLMNETDSNLTGCVLEVKLRQILNDEVC